MNSRNSLQKGNKVKCKLKCDATPQFRGSTLALCTVPPCVRKRDALMRGEQCITLPISEEEGEGFKGLARYLEPECIKPPRASETNTGTSAG